MTNNKSFQGQFSNVIPVRLAKLTAVILQCNLQTILLQLERTTCQKTGQCINLKMTNYLSDSKFGGLGFKDALTAGSRSCIVLHPYQSFIMARRPWLFIKSWITLPTRQSTPSNKTSKRMKN